MADSLGFVCWFTGFRHLNAGGVGIIGLLNPVTGVLLSVFLASESLTTVQLLGILFALFGIALRQTGKNSPR